MKEKNFSFKKNIIETKLLISAVVLALFMSEILEVNFFRYIVVTISTFMIILDYDENFEKYINDKYLIYKKYKRTLFFIIESFLIGYILNCAFWIVTKNIIFKLDENILKNTLIANIIVVISINLIFIICIDRIEFDKLKYIIMLLVISFINNNFINRLIDKVFIIRYGDFINIITTIIIAISLFILGYYILKKLLLKSLKF